MLQISLILSPQVTINSHVDVTAEVFEELDFALGEK